MYMTAIYKHTPKALQQIFHYLHGYTNNQKIDRNPHGYWVTADQALKVRINPEFIMTTHVSAQTTKLLASFALCALVGTPVWAATKTVTLLVPGNAGYPASVKN